MNSNIKNLPEGEYFTEMSATDPKTGYGRNKHVHKVLERGFDAHSETALRSAQGQVLPVVRATGFMPHGIN